MITLRRARGFRGLQIGLGLVVAGVAVVGSGCLSTGAHDAAKPSAPEPSAEARQAFTLDCSNAGGTVAGTLTVHGPPWARTCYRGSAIVSGGFPPPPPPPGTPSCWQLAKSLNCIGF